MRIYYEKTGVLCKTPCQYNKIANVGSLNCKECEHLIWRNMEEQWVDCAKETGMKVETAELQFIRDDSGRRWFPGNWNNVQWHKEGTLEEMYTYLIDEGHIITPNPLEKALKELNNTNMAVYVDRKRAEKIMRTLYEEATK